MEIHSCVGIISDDSANVIMTMLKLWERNQKVVLIGNDLPVKVVEDIFRENNVGECHCNLLDAVKYKMLNINTVLFQKEEKGCLDTKGLIRYLRPESEEIALVLYSSGTTGRAKGVMLSHKAINENADAIIRYMLPQKDDSFAIIKKLVHSSTIVGEVLVAIKSGCPLYFTSPYRNIRMMLDVISESKATITCMNPSLLALFLRLSDNELVRKTKYLRKIYISGAILSKELLIEARKRLKNCTIYNVYGMTECGPRIASQELATTYDNCSVGKPISGVKIRIMNEAGAEINESHLVGRIEVQTPYRAKGYVNGFALHIDDKGWYSTGDAGYMDEDKNLYITGRVDNMLNVAGHNVYPESVENVIRCVDGIDDCIVVGQKDEILGCILCCYYSGKKVLEKDIYEQCKCHLLPYEIPRRYEYIEAFQYTNGKIMRKQIEE